MYLPSSTYRLQLNGKFTLSHVKSCLDYFHQLGVTTLYGSPIFVAVPGSPHGYNVADPQRISPEIGSRAEFEEIAGALKEKQMGWMQDVVPNHMAYDSSNVWLMDVFEKGKHSDYYDYFDIDWQHPFPLLNGKVIAPFLSDEPEVLRQRGELTISFTQQGFFVNFPSQQFPLSWKSYYAVLRHAVAGKETEMENPEYREFVNLLEDLRSIADRFDDNLMVHEMLQNKEKLYSLYGQGSIAKDLIDRAIRKIQEEENTWKQILDVQFFLLTPANVADHRINYRRFFTVNELICLSMEQQKVFDSYHHLIQDLLQMQLIQGVRVDHVDGLYKPMEYLFRLNDLAGKEAYIVVEKILDTEETFLEKWPVQGTSGYEFAGLINQLLTCERNKEKLSAIYQSFIQEVPDYDLMVFEKRFLMLAAKMQGEVDNLVRQLLDDGMTGNFTAERLKESLAVVMSCFPVYRTYATAYPLSPETRAVLGRVFKQAGVVRPQFKDELEFLEKLLSGDAGTEVDPASREKFLMRLQQFTGPLSAKGIEDTVFYVFNRLISHNEVGDSPKISGSNAEHFHAQMKKRIAFNPYSLNATSTHDTKRGEDSRMRINVLSEIPEEWSKAVVAWKEINKKYKKGENGIQTPSANEEYFIYQSLLGAYPMDGLLEYEFMTRYKEHILKALREAKIHTDWGSPDVVYEKETMHFIDAICKDAEFICSFTAFAERISDHGMTLSLSQTLAKLTAPGIPDIYQGSELWDLNLVDPDNRRDVDYAIRKKYLQEMRSDEQFVLELKASRKDGRIKMMLMHHVLMDRKMCPFVYAEGEYLPLRFSGVRSMQLAGYARKLNKEWRVIIFPIEAVLADTPLLLAAGEQVWGDTIAILPEDAPDSWISALPGKQLNAQITDEEELNEMHRDEAAASQSVAPFMLKYLLMHEVLDTMPVALLKNKSGVLC